eukprot:350792-Chlamydomonas_euryale.AAC.9
MHIVHELQGHCHRCAKVPKGWHRSRLRTSLACATGFGVYDMHARMHECIHLSWASVSEAAHEPCCHTADHGASTPWHWPAVAHATQVEETPARLIVWVLVAGPALCPALLNRRLVRERGGVGASPADGWRGRGRGSLCESASPCWRRRRRPRVAQARRSRGHRRSMTRRSADSHPRPLPRQQLRPTGRYVR